MGSSKEPTLASDPASQPEVISAQWRKALRQLAESAPGSPDSDRLATRVRDLAAAYREAVTRLDRQSRRADGSSDRA